MKSLASYADIIPILDAALSAGAIFERPTRGEAIRWVQRANQARITKLRIEEERLRGTGVPPSTPWDHLQIIRDKDNPSKIIIMPRSPVTEVYDLQGNPLKIGRVAQAEDTDLLREAMKFAEGFKS